MKTIVIIGGGAAGFFGAITCAETFLQHRVILLEKTMQTLAKVRISGGGRCNVTHACFDPAALVRFYPRGSKELRGPFSRFQPRDTIQWFANRGVELKTEEDGRMFPVTDSSDTIIQCLNQAATKAKIHIRLGCGVQTIQRDANGFKLQLTNEETLTCDRLLLTTGSAPRMYPILEKLGHTIVPLVPSLFTFNIKDFILSDLAGVSLPHTKIHIEGTTLEQEGPLLITHWGFSGPAALKLSAWGARVLHALNYQAQLHINWVPHLNHPTQQLLQYKQIKGARQIGSETIEAIPKQLWRALLSLAQLDANQRWSTLSNQQLNALSRVLTQSSFTVEGKTTYKQEFVTCGGVTLSEVDFKTMQSRLCPGLYFAGEILDIDGVTGGFNFQNAWTTSWLAGQAIGL